MPPRGRRPGTGAVPRLRGCGGGVEAAAEYRGEDGVEHRQLSARGHQHHAGRPVEPLDVGGRDQAEGLGQPDGPVRASTTARPGAGR